MVDSQHQVVDMMLTSRNTIYDGDASDNLEVGELYISNTCESIYIVYSTFVIWLANGSIFVWWIESHGMKSYFDL